MLVCLLIAARGIAHEIEVDLEERQVIPGTAHELALVGSGTFHYFLRPVYVCALYLPVGPAPAEEALQRDHPRRITLVMLRDVRAETFVWALNKGLVANIPPSEMAALGERLQQLTQRMLQNSVLRDGDRVDLDYVPQRGTMVLLNGRSVGGTFPEKRFNDALLAVWLGERPLDASLRPKLLGREGARIED